MDVCLSAPEGGCGVYSDLPEIVWEHPDWVWLVYPPLMEYRPNAQPPKLEDPWDQIYDDILLRR